MFNLTFIIALLSNTASAAGGYDITAAKPLDESAPAAAQPFLAPGGPTDHMPNDNAFQAPIHAYGAAKRLEMSGDSACAAISVPSGAKAIALVDSDASLAPTPDQISLFDAGGIDITGSIIAKSGGSEDPWGGYVPWVKLGIDQGGPLEICLSGLEPGAMAVVHLDTLEPTFELAVAAPAQVMERDTFRIEAMLAGRGSRSAASVMHLDVVTENGKSYAMVDSGTAGDLVKGDGIYTASLATDDTDGTLNLRVDATGKADGEVEERTAFLQVPVVYPTATIERSGVSRLDDRVRVPLKDAFPGDVVEATFGYGPRVFGFAASRVSFEDDHPVAYIDIPASMSTADRVALRLVPQTADEAGDLATFDL